MKYEFLNVFLDYKSLLSSPNSGINQFLLENNTSQLEQIHEFYKRNINLLYVNGLFGTGKDSIVRHSLSFLSKETVVLKYNCFNSTVLDDILLSFFNEFKNLVSQGVISELKIKTENFTQKINSYFTHIEKPFLIILNSFEAILDENLQEILDFIIHLNSMQKIKIIIIGRTFERKNFKDIEISTVTTQALNRHIFEKYLKAEKIKAFPELYDELYKHSHGNYFFTAFSIKLMKNQNISLFDFLKNFKSSFLPFGKYLENQALTMIEPYERNLFLFLSIIRHPVSINLLKKLDLYNEEKVQELTDNLILVKDSDNIYVQDYLKDELDQNIFGHLLNKIRQSIIDLYLSQLPLKPFERDICISRQTMRKEIEFHKLFLPRTPKLTEIGNLGLNYVTYSKSIDLSDSKEAGEDKQDKSTDETSKIEFEPKKSFNLNFEKMLFDSENIDSKIKQEKEETTEKKYSFRELVELIEKAEASYNYADVIDYSNKLLLMKDDKAYESKLPEIHLKLAFAYHKLAQYENSLKYYEFVLNHYKNIQNIKQANHIKFNIAKIYYDKYKTDKAKSLFKEIVQSEESPDYLVVKSHLQLANLEEDSSGLENAFLHYKKAIEKSHEMMDIQILLELYFKYALVLDDKNDVENALEYYQKCIDLSSDSKVNAFLSSAYSNIAIIYNEKNNLEQAVFNYKKALEADKETENYEGSYYSASKLASILQRKAPNEALNYFNTALEYAKKTKDIFYIVSATLALGDFYYDNKKDEFALKYYLTALDTAKNNLSKDNISKIELRINDLKFRLGTEKFENLVNIIKSQGN